MILTNVILVILFISIYLILFFLSRNNDNYLIGLIILTTISIPGIQMKLGSNIVLINLCDMLIPLTWIKLIVFSRNKVRNNSINIIELLLIIYIVIIGISIFTSLIRLNNIYFNSILKYIRIIYIAMSYYISKKLFNIKDIRYILKIIIISGIITSILAIILFFTQNEYFKAEQTVAIGSDVLYRAGGIYKEATTFANMMSINIIISLIIILKKEFYLTKYCYLNFFLSLVGLVISFTRISFISIFICIALIITMNNKKINIRKIIIVMLIFIVIFGFLKDNIYINTYLYQRIYTIFTINSENINGVSSGRIDIWFNTVNSFFRDPSLLIFGSGYKIENFQSGFLGLADNNFISSLTQTGILGFISFISLNLIIIFKCLKDKIPSNNKYETIRSIVLFLWINNIIYMFTSDVFTFYRNIIINFIIIGIMNSFYNNKYLQHE